MVNTATVQPAEEVRVVLLRGNVSGCKENDAHVPLQTLDYPTQEVEVIFHIWHVNSYSVCLALRVRSALQTAHRNLWSHRFLLVALFLSSC